MPNDLPPWAAVCQQTQRWLQAAGWCFEALVDDLRMVLRLAAGRKAEPTVAIIDSRTLRSTPESGEKPLWEQTQEGLEVHVTPASAEDRSEVERLARTVQASLRIISIPYVDQGYTGACAADAAIRHGIALEVIKLPEASAASVFCRAAGRRALICLDEPLPPPSQRLKALC